MNSKFSKSLLVAAMMFCMHLNAPAADDPKSMQQVPPVETLGTVEVEGMRKSDEKPYRKIFKGMEVFEKYHNLAPAAPLRFRLYPRAADTSFDGLAVKLVGDKTDIPVKLDSDHSFSLPKDAEAADEDAYVTTNRKPRSFAWRVDIRTPGMPPNTRRLGDLRLECEVEFGGAGLVTKILTPASAAYLAMNDACKSKQFTYPFFGECPVFNVTLQTGKRLVFVSSLKSNGGIPELFHSFVDWEYLQDRLFRLPLWDENLPDDTLVEIEYI